MKRTIILAAILIIGVLLISSCKPAGRAIAQPDVTGRDLANFPGNIAGPVLWGWSNPLPVYIYADINIYEDQANIIAEEIEKKFCSSPESIDDEDDTCYYEFESEFITQPTDRFIAIGTCDDLHIQGLLDDSTCDDLVEGKAVIQFVETNQLVIAGGTEADATAAVDTLMAYLNGGVYLNGYYSDIINTENLIAASHITPTDKEVKYTAQFTFKTGTNVIISPLDMPYDKETVTAFFGANIDKINKIYLYDVDAGAYMGVYNPDTDVPSNIEKFAERDYIYVVDAKEDFDITVFGAEPPTASLAGYYNVPVDTKKVLGAFITGAAVNSITGGAVAGQTYSTQPLYQCRRPNAYNIHDYYVSLVYPCPVGETLGVLGRIYSYSEPQPANTALLKYCYTANTAQPYDDHFLAINQCDPHTQDQADVPNLGYVYTTKPTDIDTVILKRCRFEANGEHYQTVGACADGDHDEGTWYMLPFCSETDEGKDPTAEGTTTSLIEQYPETRSDYCVGSERLMEAFCDTSTLPHGVKQEQINCPEHHVCSDGACVPQYSFTINKTDEEYDKAKQEVTFKIVVDNTGTEVSETAEKVIIKDELPNGLTIKSITPEPTSTTGNVLEWEFEGFDNDENINYHIQEDTKIYQSEGKFEITIVAEINEALLPPGTEVTNKASVTMGTFVSEEDTATIEVEERPPVELTNPVYRCWRQYTWSRFPTTTDHYLSFNEDCEDGNLDGYLGHVYKDEQPNTQALYQCYRDHKYTKYIDLVRRDHVYADHFASTDENCEGYKYESLIGYIPETETENTQKVYRCWNRPDRISDGRYDHKLSTQLDCETYNNENVIFYFLKDPVITPGGPPPPANLEITKTGPATAQAGNEIEYSITITNPTDNTIYFTLTEKLPEHTTYIDNSQGWIPISETETEIVWEMGIPGNDGYTVKITIKVDPDITATEITNEIEIEYDTTTKTASATTSITPLQMIPLYYCSLTASGMPTIYYPSIDETCIYPGTTTQGTLIGQLGMILDQESAGTKPLNTCVGGGQPTITKFISCPGTVTENTLGYLFDTEQTNTIELKLCLQTIQTQPPFPGPSVLHLTQLTTDDTCPTGSTEEDTGFIYPVPEEEGPDCGDGNVDAGEECDQGKANAEDDCDANEYDAYYGACTQGACVNCECRGTLNCAQCIGTADWNTYCAAPGATPLPPPPLIPPPVPPPTLPPFPHQFYGNVINGTISMPIQATLAAVSFNTIIDANIQYGYTPIFLITGTTDGALISFYVNNSLDQTYAFQQGALTQLDLTYTAGGAPPTGPTCTDNVLNQDETDVDCGGTVCPKCNRNENCTKNSDCKTGYCKNGVCKTRPVTRISGGGGGGSRGKYVTAAQELYGMPQQVTTACSDDWICDPWGPCLDGTQVRECFLNDYPECLLEMPKPDTTQSCVMPEPEYVPLAIPTCFDGIQNQDETFTDCGGSICKPCDPNLPCMTSRDCVTNYCDPIVQMCGYPPVVEIPKPPSLWWVWLIVALAAIGVIGGTITAVILLRKKGKEPTNKLKDLKSYVDKYKKKGVSTEKIRKKVLEHGWKKETVDKVLK